ncbi:MAG: hypothetical protein WAW37_04305 [Syntrophobacteraceae bacterium]
MNRLIVLLISCVILCACASPEERARASFKVCINQIQSFLQNNPIYIDKQKFSLSPSGYIYIPTQFINVEIRYDIERTNSLVTPFAGTILFDSDLHTSQTCGNILISGVLGSIEQNLAFIKYNDAIHSKDNGKCYKYFRRNKLVIMFVYQDEKWVFKDVINSATNASEADTELIHDMVIKHLKQ